MGCLYKQKLPGKIEPFRAYFGAGQCSIVTTVADVSDSLNEKYWLISVPASFFNSAKTAKDFYVWYNSDSGTDPLITADGIEVVIDTNDSAAVVAQKTKTALDAMSPKRFRVLREGAKLTIENLDMGEVADAAAGNSTFTVSVEKGFGGDLGNTSTDGAELSIEAEAIPITSLQAGGLVLDQFFSGGTVSLSLGLQETDINTWSLALKTTGSSFTPSGGTKVAGIGEGALYRSYLENGGQLTLKPLSTEQNDSSRNVTLWRCAPTVESVNFNNDIQVLQCSFTSLLDPTRDKRVNAFLFGDQEQAALSLI
jgi:hypothetical protein